MAERKRFVSPDNVETMVFGWGTIKWLCEPRVTQADAITAGVVVLDPGKGHNSHNHPGAEEILYIISGEGDQMVEDDSRKPVTRKVSAGDLVYIPDGVFHATVNTGWEPMRILAVYSPPGAETTLRQLPDYRAVPAGQVPVR